VWGTIGMESGPGYKAASVFAAHQLAKVGTAARIHEFRVY